jgi:hypothetical protein
MRYHTVTLIAVFLALTIGILLGASSGGAWFETSREGMVQAVLDQYQETRQLNKRLEQELATHKERLQTQQAHSQRVFREAVRRRLDARFILMVGETDGSGTIEAAFREAGAMVERTRFFPRDYERYDAIVLLSRPPSTQLRQSRWLSALRVAFDGPVVSVHGGEPDRPAFGRDRADLWMVSASLCDHPDRLVRMITWLSDTTKKKEEAL